MTTEEIKELWGDELFNVFADHIDEDGFLTNDWHLIIENEIPKFDNDWNDNPKHTETYQRMYLLDTEKNSDGTKIRPVN